MKNFLRCLKNEETHRHRWRKEPKTKRQRKVMKKGWKVCNRCGLWAAPRLLKIIKKKVRV